MTKPQRNDKRLDWDAIKRRLPTSLGFEESAEALERVFKERAEDLARPASDVTAATREPHLCFRIGQARFAFALAEIRTILKPQALTRVPCAPPHLAHILHSEGRIVALIDLAVMLQLGEREKSGSGLQAVVLDAPGSPLGVLVDRVDGLRSIETAQLGSAARVGPGADFVRGVSSDMTLVISTEQLIRSIANSTRTQRELGTQEGD